jgi:hypothetical protein
LLMSSENSLSTHVILQFNDGYNYLKVTTTS